MKSRIALLLPLLGVPLFGQYVWDYNVGGSYGLNYAQWSFNGSAGYYGFPLQFGSAGSMMLVPAVPVTNPTTNLAEPNTSSSDYDVSSTLVIYGGGTFIHFLRASSDTLTPGTGSYIAVALVAPSGFQYAGSVTVNISQCVSGTVTQLASTTATASSDMATLRTVVFGTNLWVFVNNAAVCTGTVPLTSGGPGIGGYMGASGGFESVSVGHHDVVGPIQIPASSVASSVMPNSASLRWAAVADDPNGVGTSIYEILKNGSYLAQSPQPEFTDANVQPSTTYTYTLYAIDYHGNLSAPTTLTVNTPPAGNVDPRRIGVSSTGSYWGGAGEQIDTLSGNLHFSVPLLAAQGRTGWTVPVNLVYDSQNWRQDNGTNWNLGTDVGFGYGWKMLIGSITPYYTSLWGGVDHYVYTDSTGAQYRLDQNNSGVWTPSTQSVYVWLDTTVSPNKLHFRDGKFWVMGATSGGTEQDAGTMYPTTIEDPFGNQVLVWYDTGAGLPYEYSSTLPSGSYSPLNWLVTENTSSRIIAISDSRSVYCGWGSAVNAVVPCAGESEFGYFQDGSLMSYATYGFVYDHKDYTIPHLVSYTNFVGTAETGSGFTYTTVTQEPPFGTDPNYGAQAVLLSQAALGTASPYQFGYDAAGAGELTSLVFPYGAEMIWNYDSFAYAGNRSLREVSTRTLAPDALHATNPAWAYTLSRPDPPNSVTVHSAMTLTDSTGASKAWSFTASGSGGSVWQIGLISQIAQSSNTYQYTWSQDPGGRPYISAQTVTIGVGTSNPQSALSTQTLDQYGNVTQSAIYPYGSTMTPLQTYTNIYLTASNYTSNYVFNLLASMTLNTGSGPFPVVTNTYDTAGCATSNDGYSVCGGWNTSSPGGGIAYDNFTPVPAGSQGAPMTSVGVKGAGIFNYSKTGMVASVNNDDGTTATASADAATNYAAPQTIMVQNYTQTVGYTPFLGVSQTTGANGEQMTMTYDSYGRPKTATSPYGAVWTYAYTPTANGPPYWQSKTGPDGYTLTTVDGLGRVASVQRGTSASSIVSEADTVYAPGAISPLGLMQEVSQPYAIGATKYWTTYTYL